MTAVRATLNTIAMTALVVLALAPMSAAYQDTAFWIAGVGGAAIGAIVAVCGWRWRWPVLVVAAVTAVAYFVFGGALVFRESSLLGAIPTPDVLSALALGVVQSWKQMLTLQAPFAGFEQLFVVPYLSALVAAVVAASLALRLRRWFGVAVLAPGLLLVLSIAFSTYRAFAPGVTGATWGGLALVWALWRVRGARADAAAAPDQPDAAAARRRWPAGAAAAVLVVAVALAGGGVAAATVTVTDRDVLRDHVVPPLDLHDYASPLTSYRKYVRDGADSTLFTVTGLPAGASVRLATLDMYDGIVYAVSGSGGAGAGTFARVGREIPSVTAGDPAEVTVTVGDLSGVWVPTVGYATRIAFDDDGGDDGRQDALHYNASTGTAIVTDALATGDVYRLDAVLAQAPTEDDLLAATVADITTPAPAAVPDEVTSMLDKITGAAATPVEQVRAIEAYFQTTGFYSSGLEGQVTSRSGHTLERESALLGGTQMIGDDEQYAVAMALMVSQLGIPVRVVMGFQPRGGDDPVAVTGDDLHAWVEVPFDGLGWVAFSPTPSKDRVPQQETLQQQQKPQAQVAQPPQSPQEPAELPPTTPVEDAGSEDSPLDLGWLWATLRIGGTALLILLALLGPSVALAVAKSARRRRRSGAPDPVDRFDGAWSELIDAAVDVGAPVLTGATRREQARALDDRYPPLSVSPLAIEADAVVFGVGEPLEGADARYWDAVGEAAKTLRAAVPWHRRVLGAAFPASVLRSIRGAGAQAFGRLWNIRWPRRSRANGDRG